MIVLEKPLAYAGTWFGDNEAITAVKSEAIGKPEVLESFGCVVGVRGASFDVPRGKIFRIMGLSGSGKSTLVRHVNRLIEPTAGKIEILGQDVSAISDTELRCIRAQQIGMVFQHMALTPHRSEGHAPGCWSCAASSVPPFLPRHPRKAGPAQRLRGASGLSPCENEHTVARALEFGVSRRKQMTRLRSRNCWTFA
jgi:ABC-type Fe3+/spermidine/putrescine transport system ATPase subunit